MVFHLSVIICLFLGWWDGNVDKYFFLNICSCNVIYEGFYNFGKVCLQFFSFLNVVFF